MTPIPYQPWRASEFPRLTREIATVTWPGDGELRIEIAEAGDVPPALALIFPRALAYQGIDEGLRLMDSPNWSSVRALIYTSRDSPYLGRFLENAAWTMDAFPLIHWMVASCNECVDVITEFEPRIVLL